MSFAITGLTNANEFYSQHYLDEILEKDLKPLFDQWKEQGAQSPVARLRTAAGANGYFRARERFLNERKTSERASLFIDLVQPLLAALGYELAPQNLTLAEGELPVIAVYRDAKHQPLLVIAAAIANAEDEDSSSLQLLAPAASEQGKGKYAHSAWEETLSKRLFADDHPPRWVLLLHHEEWLLIERSKWGRKALLRFNLPELFGPRDDKQFRAMAALLGSQSVLPVEGGVALLDSLDDSSHKHAFEVSTDLKYALRECIELIANEAIWYKRTVAKEKVFERNDTDLADQLSRESLRYMYRLLFMFYIEARPELGYAPIDAEAYLKGYSIEHLRELEQTPLTTSEAQEGFYFNDSLKQLFGLIWQGYPRRDATASQLDLGGSHDGLLDNGFTIAPLQGHLFDPARTPLLGSVKLRNSVLQKVIELMSLSRGGGKSRRGRISYGTLGINQLVLCTNRCCPSVVFSPKKISTRYALTPTGRRQVRAKRAKKTIRARAIRTERKASIPPAQPRRKKTPKSTRWMLPTLYLPVASASTPTPNGCLAAIPRFILKAALSIAWPVVPARSRPATTPLKY